MSTIDVTVLTYLNALANANPFWYAFAYVCSSYLIVFLILGALVYIFREKDTTSLLHARRLLADVILSVLLASAIGFLLGAFIGRARPFVTLSDIQIIGSIPSNSSFPSAHTWIATAIAAVLCLKPAHRKAGYLFFVLAALVALGRVMAGFHYPSDVLGGIAVGIGSAFLIVHGQVFFRWLARVKE